MLHATFNRKLIAFESVRSLHRTAQSRFRVNTNSCMYRELETIYRPKWKTCIAVDGHHCLFLSLFTSSTRPRTIKMKL